MSGEKTHTPGPWRAFYKPKYDEWHITLPAPGLGLRLALCRDGIESENREADARLIAAAPDMLAVLKRIAAPHSCGCVPCVGDCTSKESLEITLAEIRDIARAAIALATPAEGERTR